jgi:hypothetical protein
MSKAADVFALSIQDAENLLKLFNASNTRPPPPETEVLKRAGLIMAMTAWETYVEDRVRESAEKRLAAINDISLAGFVKTRLDEEIGRLHNPTSDKTIRLFRDYAGVDLTEKWCWNHHEPKLVRERLNQYLSLRGDVVHRSRAAPGKVPMPHPVKKEDLERAIRFIKELVKATEAALASES